jgi:hypothetical protein
VVLDLASGSIQSLLAKVDGAQRVHTHTHAHAHTHKHTHTHTHTHKNTHTYTHLARGPVESLLAQIGVVEEEGLEGPRGHRGGLCGGAYSMLESNTYDVRE